MRGAARQFAKVISCDYCSTQGFPKLLRDDTFNLPQPGYIGSNYRSTGVLLIGQNPGISPGWFSVQDREFADAQIALRDDPSAQTMADYKDVLDRNMPVWDVFRTYFPIAECDLQLEDIAYLNVVRCRTEGNTSPGSRMTRACIDNHLIGWLDWLQPRVVVCIGKRAHDRIGALLEERGIPNGVVNRWRSLPRAERQQNRAQVVDLVCSVVSGKSPEAIEEPEVLEQAQMTSVRTAHTVQVSTRPLAKGVKTMNKEEYIDLFRALGFHNIEIYKTLKHRKPISSLYFNHKYGFVSFVAYAQDEHRFPAHLWERIPPQKKKDDKPNLITIVPKAGRERQAFEDLLA